MKIIDLSLLGWLAVAILAAGFLFAGCGGGDDESNLCGNFTFNGAQECAVQGGEQNQQTGEGDNTQRNVSPTPTPAEEEA